MKRKEIIGALKDAEKPLHIEELSKKTEISIPKLRIDLYRLQEEGSIENTEKEGEVKWKLKKKSSIEEKYERMSER